jgi:AraC family transcriptional regulator
MAAAMNTEAVRQSILHQTGGIRDLESVVVEYAANLRQGVHRHTHASITLVLQGSLEEGLADGSLVAGPLAMITKPHGAVHSSAYGAEGCRTLQLNFAKEFDLGLPKSGGLTARRHDGGAAVAALLGLLKLATSNLPGRGDDVVFLLYEAIAALTAQCEQASVPPWLARTKKAIDASGPTTRWTAAGLSREAGVHPVHLTKQFRRHYGRSVREYLKLRRFYAAAKAVAEDNQSLSAIAHAFGYADQAHFCRAFRAVAHLSAGDYRNLLQRLECRAKD